DAYIAPIGAAQNAAALKLARELRREGLTIEVGDGKFKLGKSFDSADKLARHLCEDCLQKEYEEFAHTCVHKSIDQNDLWLEKYKIGTWGRWDYSLEDATLTFSQDGKPKVVCNIQAIGSVMGNSWEWSWGNENLPDSCKTRMNEVREFGEEKQW